VCLYKTWLNLTSVRAPQLKLGFSTIIEACLDMAKQGAAEPLETDAISLADIERGERIKQARVKANLSAGQFAEAMGLTPSSVSQWESGRTKPTRERLKKLCEVLNCSPAWIEGRSQDSGSAANGCFVPMVSIERAARGLALALEAGDIGPDNGIQVLQVCSLSSFAVKIDSDRFRPDVSNGAILVIDPAGKEAIKPLDVVLATYRGRPELLQAFHADPKTHALQALLETDLEPKYRAQLAEILEIVRGRQPAGLIYLRLGDGAKVDTAEMRIMGPVVQRTEGRSWSAMTRAVMYFSNEEMARIAEGFATVAQDKPVLPSSPKVDDVA
jgi:transcriptional regulator with XRE-family HTH domain